MRNGARTAAAFVAAGLAAAGWILIRSPEAPPRTEVLAAAAGESEPAPIERDAIEASSREPAELGAFVIAKPALPPAPDPAEADARAEAAVAGLRESIEAADVLSGEARVLADGLRSEVGDAAVPALARIAGYGDDLDAIAAAALLVPLVDTGPFDLPGAALAALRRACLVDEPDPRCAFLAVATLARFGDALDRKAILDRVRGDASEGARSFALCGLRASRGDDAALELALASASSTEPRLRDLALIALVDVACAEDWTVSEGGRARCLAILQGQLELAEARGERPSHLVDALSVLDSEAMARVLLAELADARTPEARAQAFATRLSKMPPALDGLRAITSDATLPDSRRVYAAEALLRAKAELTAEARSLLERLRDGSAGTPLGRRAVDLLGRADARESRGNWPP